MLRMMDTMLGSELEALLKRQIPISEHLAIGQLQLHENTLTLQLPLAPNRNHKQTLFGGSLYAAGALSCYGLFLAGLRTEQIPTENIVISQGEMSYLAPVDTDALVVAKWSSQPEREQFFKTLRTKHKARVQMKAQIFVQQKVCAEFTGQFVAKL